MSAHSKVADYLGGNDLHRTTRRLLLRLRRLHRLRRDRRTGVDDLTDEDRFRLVDSLLPTGIEER